MSTRPPQPGPNFYWNDLLKTWLPNSQELANRAQQAVTGSVLNTVLAPVATSGAAQTAVQNAAAETLASKILKYKTPLMIGLGLVGVFAIYKFASSKKR